MSITGQSSRTYSSHIALTPGPMYFAIFPRQTVVFVRIPASASLEVLARYLSRSPFIVLRSLLWPTVQAVQFVHCDYDVR